jgi:hypothetical protein
LPSSGTLKIKRLGSQRGQSIEKNEMIGILKVIITLYFNDTDVLFFCADLEKHFIPRFTIKYFFNLQ